MSEVSGNGAMSEWIRTDNPMTVEVRLACGHTIQASENDGGMDELPVITWPILEDTVRRRVTTHAILGCGGARAIRIAAGVSLREACR